MTNYNEKLEQASKQATVFVVVSCMGRLSFLRQTLGTVLSDPTPRYCLVDYSFPEHCGEWIRHSWSTEVQSGRLIIESVAGKTHFNKSAAFNAGARRALAEGAEYICFLDADTIVQHGFFPWLLPQLQQGTFLIAGLRFGYDIPSLTGVLVVSADDFKETTGFDEAFEGWGAEDIEFRVRLHMVHGFRYRDIPPDLLRPIEHSDELRTQFYAEKYQWSSDTRQLARVRAKLTHWERLHPDRIASARRLMYQFPGGTTGEDPMALEAAVRSEPDNPHAVFRLAQLYRGWNRLEAAEELYERRVAMGDAEEEVWWSLFALALIALMQNRSWADVENQLLRAYHYCPKRAEPLCTLAARCRQLGRHSDAYRFASVAITLAEPTDCLMIDKAAYEWGRFVEYAHAAWHTGRFAEALDANRRLLTCNTLPTAERARAMENEAACVEQLACINGQGPASTPVETPDQPSTRLSTLFENIDTSGALEVVFRDHLANIHRLARAQKFRRLLDVGLGVGAAAMHLLDATKGTLVAVDPSKTRT